MLQVQYAQSKTGPKLWKDSRLLMIYAITLSAGMGIVLITPVFPQIVQLFDISREQAALLITAYTLPGVFLAPLYGFLADRWGRKQVLVPLILLFGLAGTACGMARDFELMLVLRVLQGVGSGALFTLNNTLIGDLFDGDERFTAMGYNASVMGLAMAIYPAIGGILGKIHWSVPFYIPALALALGWLIAFRFKVNPLVKSHTLTEYLFGVWSKVMTLRYFALLFASLLTFMLMMGVMISFMPFFLADRFSAGPAKIGWILSLMAVSGGIASMLTGQLQKIASKPKLVGVSFLLYAIGLFFIPYSGNMWVVAIPVAIQGFGQGLGIPLVQGLLTHSAPTEYRGMAMAINAAVILLGNSTGPVIAGIINKAAGLDFLFTSSAVVALTSSLVIYLMLNRLLPHPPELRR